MATNESFSRRPDESGSGDGLAMELAAIQPRLYGYILKRIADREHTLDVLQRTNLVICSKAAEFQRGTSFTAWAFTIAKFQVMAWRKSEGANRLVLSENVIELLDRQASQEVESVDRRIPLLHECLDGLSSADRSLIQRRYRDGDALSPIAKSMSKSVEAVGMQLTRIRRQLAECVRGKLNEETSYEI